MSTAQDKIRAEKRRKAIHKAGEKAIKEKPLLPSTQEQLAIVARHLEPVFQKRPDGKPFDKPETWKAVTLCDLMHRDKMLSMDQWMASQRFKELYWLAEGPSRGVSQYGDFDPGEPIWERTLTNQRQMNNRDEFMLACFAAFAVPTNELYANGKIKWVVDAELMKWGTLAMVHEHKDVTQAAIGNALSPYKGRAQRNAAGGEVIWMITNRLTLHFGYRQR